MDSSDTTGSGGPGGDDRGADVLPMRGRQSSKPDGSGAELKSEFVFNSVVIGTAWILIALMVVLIVALLVFAIIYVWHKIGQLA